MVGPSHAICALGVAVAGGHALGVTPSRVELFFYLIGTLSPDIDGDGSIARPGTLLKSFLGWKIARFIDNIAATVGAMAKSISGHRGFFHWPIVAFTLIGAGYFLASGNLLWFGIGYLIHIACDTLTHQGIQLLAPLRFKEYSARLFATGSAREFLLTACVLVATIYWGFSLLPLSLQDGFDELRGRYLHHASTERIR